MRKAKILFKSKKSFALFLPLFVLALTGCYFEFGNSGGLFTNLASVGEDFTSSDSEFMYVDLDSARYETQNTKVPYYEVSTTEQFGDAAVRDSVSNCEIEYIPFDEDEDEENELHVRRASPFLICILDMMEWDLSVKDLHIVYNFPQGMCESVSVALPWHFNHPIIPGPNIIECNIGGGDDASKGYCNDTGSNECEGGELSCTEKEEDVCPGSPKCCVGGEKTDGAAWSLEEECFGGPGTVLTTSGFADFTKKYITDLPEDGMKQSLSMKSILTINNNIMLDNVSISSPLANYMKALDQAPDDFSFNSRNLPEFLRPSPHYPYVPRPFFEFICIDDTGEELHKIFLMIREWNTLEEFIKFHDAGGIDDADPDVEGYEGADCDYELLSSSDGDRPCNDLLDLDDIASCNKSLYSKWCDHFLGEGIGESTATQVTSAPYPRLSYDKQEDDRLSGESGESE